MALDEYVKTRDPHNVLVFPDGREAYLKSPINPSEMIEASKEGFFAHLNRMKVDIYSSICSPTYPYCTDMLYKHFNKRFGIVITTDILPHSYESRYFVSIDIYDPILDLLATCKA